VVQFRVGANQNSTTREGALNINNERALVRQAASPCSLQAAINDGHFTSSGGAATITVTTPGGCAWTASTNAGWIVLAAPASGSGAATLGVTIAQNVGAQRAGTITIGGDDIAVVQDGVTPGQAPCVISLLPTSVSMPAAGGSSSTAVTTNAGCAWTATSQAPWITITPPASGSGNGSVAFTVAANVAPTARNSSITVAGVIFAVSQAGTLCAPSINPTSQSIGAAGGAGTPVAVSAAAGCAWTATSNAVWLTIISGVAGTGNGTVTFTVAANGSSSRTGTLTIAGQTFTVNQAAAPCTYSINPTSQSIGAAGGAGTPVAVSAAAGCAWTATSNAVWLTIASGASGTGNGTVTFNVAANGSSSRIGTLTIAGQTFTVNQAAAAPCTYSINPTSQTIGSDAVAGGPVSVTAGAGCTWISTANASWLHIASGASGTGNGTVTFTADSFPGGGASRTGTLTIAGQTFTVNQVRCSGTLSPESQSNVPATGGPFSVSLTTQTGCQWTVTSNVTWMTITNGSSGTGSKTVNYLVAPNPGGARSGRLTFVFSNGDDERLNVNQLKN